MMSRRGLLVSAASGLIAAPRRAPAAMREGGAISVAIFADPLSFDPHLTANVQGRGATRSIHDTLLTIDENGRLAPGLAVSWSQPDEKTWVLQLREGVKFHDGTPFDAAAVQYNLKRVFDPQLGSIRTGELSPLDGTDVIDPHTIRMRLKTPFSVFLYVLTDVSGCIGSPAAMESLGKDYGLHPVGTGPFKLADYLKDAHTILEKNGEYWMPGKPLLDRVTLRPIPTDSTRLAELRSGGVQLAEALPLQDISRLRQSQEIVVSERVGFRWEYFGFNCNEAFPGHARPFRQAFQYAIDREALHHVAYFGTGAIGYDGILPSSPFFDATYKPYTRDLDRAKRLIDQAGLSGPVVITAPLQPDPVKQRAAQVFQANAAELGVQIRIEQVDSAGYAASLASGKMAMDLQGWWGYRPDPDQYLAILLGTKGSYAKYNSYVSPEMDTLIATERGTSDEAVRRKAFRRMSEVMNDDAAYVPWHDSSDFKGLSKQVHGFFHPADGIVSYRDITVG